MSDPLDDYAFEADRECSGDWPDEDELGKCPICGSFFCVGGACLNEDVRQEKTSLLGQKERLEPSSTGAAILSDRSTQSSIDSPAAPDLSSENWEAT